MYMPQIGIPSRKTRRQIVRFGGLNATEDRREGELAASRGLSGGAYPCLSQRGGRRLVRRTAEGSSLFAHGELVTVQGGSLFYGAKNVAAVTPGRKQFAVVNTKLCVFPDKLYLDLDTGEAKSLEAGAVNVGQAVFTEDAVTFAPDLTTETGRTSHFMGYRLLKSYNNGVAEEWAWELPSYTAVRWDKTARTWITEGEERLFVNDADKAKAKDLPGRFVILAQEGSGTYDVEGRQRHKTWGDDPVEEYDNHQPRNTAGRYAKILTATVEEVQETTQNTWYLNLTLEVHDATVGNPPLEGVFNVGDRVDISGCRVAENDREKLQVAAVEGGTVTFVLAEGSKLTPGVETGAVTLERKVPELDFICESDNRLWGCSNRDKTIYASALGDPTNFYVYDGLSTDSYAVAVGSAGEFTGCVAYGGSVLFWKEDQVHKLLGSYPAAYELYTYQLSGLQRGSERSMTIVNETLYYKGRDGVYAYTGGAPRLLSAALGPTRWDSAAGGSDGRSYTLSMRRQDTGTWALLTLHLQTGLWFMEDELEARDFAALDGTLYMLTGAGVYALDQGGDDEGAPIPWEAEFVPFTETTHDRKYPVRLLLRLELAPGAWVEAELARDGGSFRPVWTCHEAGAVTAAIPLRPGRCDRYAVRLRGEGRCLVRSMAREFFLGGAR